jgi:ATP-binding cassette, subfamily B, bacterial CvaB/MchF/RaxB
MQTTLNYSLFKSAPLIFQSEIVECGLASMAMVACYYGYKLDMLAMCKRFSANLTGMNLQQLIELGDNLGLACRALQCPIEEVHKLQTPCILHWGMNHFVVLKKVSGKDTVTKFAINDPTVGKRSLNAKELGKHFTAHI